MIVIGCTGGIGSGKSTVCSLLAARGAQVINADDLAREALERPGAAFLAVRERFAEALDQDGAIDRARLAEVVFSDQSARRDLEAIVHPVVEAELARRLGELGQDPATSDGVLVLEVALLVETNGRARYHLDGLLVVDVPEELALERLTRFRQMDRDDALARIAAQSPRAERLRAADFVILNTGTLDELALMAENAWRWMQALRVDAE